MIILTRPFSHKKNEMQSLFEFKTNPEDTKIVHLILQDETRCNVSREIAQMSLLVKEMLEEDEDDDTPEIPIPNVSKEIMSIALEFAKHHVHDPMAPIEKPIMSDKMKDIVSPWDADYIDKLDHSTLFSLILAANYLNIPALLDLSCAKVASLIKGKTPEEIRALFKITLVMEQEEEKQIEQRWSS